MSRNNREYEIKLAVAPDATELLISHPIFRAALPERRLDRLMSTYFDTPDSALRRRRVSLRVRRAGSRTTQTLKSAGRSMVDRDEWEHDAGGLRPDTSWLRSTPLKSLFEDDGVAASLDAQFTVDVSRSTFPIAFGRAEIEAALDQGAIRGKSLSLAINELELELKAGTKKDVIALARKLARDLPLVLSLATKAERGYGVADLTWGKPTNSFPLDLAKTRTLRDAFAMIIQACLHTLCCNAALIGESHDEEDAVHKTRIALRHLRAVVVLFKPALRRGRAKAIDAEVKWMSALLGDARDADVFRHGAFDEAAREEERPGARDVAATMRDLQRHAHETLHAALASPRWRLLLLDLLAFSGNGIRNGRRDGRCAPFVRRRLAAQRRALARLTRGWAGKSSDEMHEIRKRAKMLRYGLDLVATLPGLGVKRRTLRKLGSDLSTLQQTLGQVHDRAALRDRLEDVILRNRAPRGIAPERWDAMRGAARQLGGPSPRDETDLQEARKAARRMRRCGGL